MNGAAPQHLRPIRSFHRLEVNLVEKPNSSTKAVIQEGALFWMTAQLSVEGRTVHPRIINNPGGQPRRATPEGNPGGQPRRATPEGNPGGQPRRATPEGNPGATIAPQSACFPEAGISPDHTLRTGTWIGVRLGFCQARTAARLRKMADEPQDERANPSAWRPAWERVRDLAPAVTGGVTAGTTPASL